MRRKEAILSAAFSVLVGVLMIVMKAQVVRVAMTVFGAILLISAIIDFVNKLTNSAIVKTVIGVCVLVFGWLFVEVALYILAAAIVLFGLLRIVNMHKFLEEGLTFKQKLFVYVRPVITVIAGACLLLDQGRMLDWVFILTGVLFVADGILDVIDALL